MADTVKVMVVFGTRPEAIKMAPVIAELSRHPVFKPVVVVTAQHREMLDQVLSHFHIKADYDLDIMQQRQSLVDVSARALTGLYPIMAEERPRVVLVHGDTATTFIAALAAFYARVPVGHVEAGLRTHHKYDPFPEEMFRRLTDVISDIYFAPTATARSHLLSEGVAPDNIFVTGNTAIDALLSTVQPGYRFRTPGLLELLDKPERIIVVEAHRRENWGERMHNICRALRAVLETRPDIRLIYSVHSNPEVSEVVTEHLSDHPRAHLFSPPFDYPEWANLMARCHFIVTDSGGLQEEAPALGKPVLLLRDTSERPEALAAGTVEQVGTDPRAIGRGIIGLLNDPQRYEAMATAVNPYGDGRSAERTVAGLAYALGIASERPNDWR